MPRAMGFRKTAVTKELQIKNELLSNIKFSANGDDVERLQ